MWQKLLDLRVIPKQVSRFSIPRATSKFVRSRISQPRILNRHFSISGTNLQADDTPPSSIANVSKEGIDRRLHSLRLVVTEWIESSSRESNISVGVSEPTAIVPAISLEAIRGDSQSAYGIHVSFQRPSAANSLDTELMLDLTTVFQAISQAETVSGVCLTGHVGAGKRPVFCGGANRNELASLSKPEEAEMFIRNVSGLCQSIRDVPVPVVALIDGPCIGAGLEMAASCDIRVATTASTFIMPEVLLGIPSVVEARLLCDIVGWARARHLMLTGCTWSHDEAFQAGLFTKLFETRHQMVDWADGYMKQISVDKTAYRQQKKLMRDWENTTIDEAIELGVHCFAKAFTDGPKQSLVHRPKQAITSNLR